MVYRAARIAREDDLKISVEEPITFFVFGIPLRHSRIIFFICRDGGERKLDRHFFWSFGITIVGSVKVKRRPKALT